MLRKVSIMKKDLTTKEKKFIENLASGMNQTDAYEKVYGRGNYSKKTITNKAYQVLQKEHVKIAYEELMSKATSDAIMTAIQRKEWLTKVIKDDLDETFIDNKGNTHRKHASFNDKLKAIDMLNKMDCEYIQKVEANVNNDVRIEITLDD